MNATTLNTKRMIETAERNRLMRQAKEAKYKQEVYIALLNALLFSSVLYECNEALSETTAYRHKLKMMLRQLTPELEKMINEDLSMLVGGDENAKVIFNLQDGIKAYIEQLHPERMVKHKPAHIAGLGELINQFHKMPELVLHRNGIKIKEA